MSTARALTRWTQLRVAPALVLVLVLLPAGITDAAALTHSSCQLDLAQATTERAVPGYSVERWEDGRGLTISGRIDHGLTAHVEALLDEEPGLRFLRLNSAGGIIAEARGLIRLITQHDLSTTVSDHCYSACAMAYASGTTRYLEPGARLGFHSYRLRRRAPIATVDPAAELDRDLAAMRRHDIAEDFIDRIRATPHWRMWFPTRIQLLSSRMVDILGRP